MNKAGCAAVFAASAALAAFSASALTVSKISEVNRPSSYTYGAEEISGITWLGNNLYYAVDDKDNKIYPLNININPVSGAIDGISIGTGVLVSGANDMEGCAYDPASGMIWVSEETGARIREINPATGMAVRSAPVPSIMMKYYGNYSLEALTISGDGLSMWTCNEEALQCDGNKSTKYTGSIVRLTCFTRASVYDNWTPSKQWAYLTDPIGTDPWIYNGSVKGRSGVSALVALPNGQLLVLERDLWGTSFWSATFYNRIYLVDGTGVGGGAATDVLGVSSLKGATYKLAKKTPLFDEEVGWVNYEGMCLGPRLNDGSNDGSVVLVLVADGGDCTDKIMTMKLSGLNVHTLDFEYNSPIGTSSIVGHNYRFMHGANVTVKAYGDGIETRAYTNRGDTVSSTLWSLPNHSPSSGYGPTKTFAVNADDTFTFNVYVAGCHGQWGEDAPIYMHDTFEEYAPGTFGDAIPRWSGEGEIMAKTYTPSQGSGKYVLKRAAHSKVLNAEDEAVRDISSVYLTQSDNLRMDMMVEVRKSPDPLEPMPSNVRLAVAADNNGKLQLWHYGRFSGQLKFGWSLLGNTVYANGAWVRVSIERAYTSTRAYGRVRVNGNVCSVTGGNSTQALNTGSSLVSGQWFPLYNMNLPTTLSVVGTKVDDFIIATPNFIDSPAAQSIVVAPGAANGSESTGPTFTVAVAVPAAAAPVAARPRSASSAAADSSAEPAEAVSAPAITGFGLTADSRPRIRFTGFAEGAVYRVVRSASLDFKGEDVECLDGDVTGNENGVAVWEGKSACDPSAGAKFYRIEVVE